MNLQKGLIAHWTCDSKDVSNGVHHDRSGYGREMNLQNSPTVGASAPTGESINLDGTDDLLTFNSITLDRFGSAITFWVKPASTTDMTFIGTTDDYKKMIELRSSRANCETNTNQNRFNNSNYSIKSEWHHIAIVFENEKAYWYVDGQFLSEATNYGVDGNGDSVNKMVDNVTLNRIGDPVYDARYSGGVSDLRFYNRPLSDKEVNAIAQQRTTRSKSIKPYETRPQPGDGRSLMDPSVWEHGTNGNQGDFSTNGTNDENSIIKGHGPYGDIVNLWYGRSEDTSSGGEGGWNWYGLNVSDIDTTKKHRYSVWVKQEYTSGKVYH